MASGKAVDEQYADWREVTVPSARKEAQPVIAPTRQSQPFDEDYDPNDIDVVRPPNRGRGAPIITAGPSGFRPPIDSEDEDDYN